MTPKERAKAICERWWPGDEKAEYMMEINYLAAQIEEAQAEAVIKAIRNHSTAYDDGFRAAQENAAEECEMQRYIEPVNKPQTKWNKILDEIAERIRGLKP